MNWFWRQDRDYKRIEKRLKELEDAVWELSSDVGTVRARVMSLNGKIAVEARETKKAAKTSFEKELESVYKGAILAIKTPSGETVVNDAVPEH